MGKNRIIYIKKNASKQRFEVEEPLDATNFNIGTTYEDYLQGAFVLLTNDLIAFMEEHPNASILEIYNMALTEIEFPAETIEDVRARILAKLQYYNSSANVDSFIINNSIVAWLTPLERANYKQSVEAAELLGIETLSFYINDIMLNISPTEAKIMLALLLLYADACYLVNKLHQIAIENLGTIEELENYDYTAGYPDKLYFSI